MMMMMMMVVMMVVAVAVVVRQVTVLEIQLDLSYSWGVTHYQNSFQVVTLEVPMVRAVYSKYSCG